MWNEAPSLHLCRRMLAIHIWQIENMILLAFCIAIAFCFCLIFNHICNMIDMSHVLSLKYCILYMWDCFRCIDFKRTYFKCACLPATIPVNMLNVWLKSGTPFSFLSLFYALFCIVVAAVILVGNIFVWVLITDITMRKYHCYKQIKWTKINWYRFMFSTANFPQVTQKNKNKKCVQLNWIFFLFLPSFVFIKSMR